MAHVGVVARGGRPPSQSLPPQTGEEVGGDAPGGRVVRAAVVRDVARCGGRRCPAPFPARRPQGTPLRFGKGRPCGGRPQGIGPVAGGHKGSPLWRAATRDRPYGGRPQGIAPTEVGHKGSPLRVGGNKGSPLRGDAPVGGAWVAASRALRDIAFSCALCVCLGTCGHGNDGTDGWGVRCGVCFACDVGLLGVVSGYVLAYGYEA